MPGQQSKKGSKIGRNKRQPSKVKYTAAQGGLKRKRPLKKGSNQAEHPRGIVLDEHKSRSLGQHHAPIVRRPHLGNELMEIHAMGRDSDRGQRAKETAETHTRHLRPPFRSRALAVDPEVVRTKGVRTIEY